MDFKQKEIIGMIHLAGPNAIEKAIEEIKIYEEEGLSGIIIENYHGSISEMYMVLEYLKLNPTTLSVGVNVLPNEFFLAFEMCEKYSFIDFIQLDYIAGRYAIGTTIIELDADLFIEKSMNAKNVKVYGGVWPKYYSPIKESILSVDIFDAVFLGSGVVVTGEGTGYETPLDKIKEFNKLIDGECPLIVGAGLTPQNVKEQLEYAQGAIVGSAFKPNGKTRQMVDRDLVREFMNAVKEI